MIKTADQTEENSKICPVAVGLLFDAEGRILVAERPGPYYPGFWEFPGGKIEPGESSRMALSRELKEELGIEVEVATPLFEMSHTYPERTVVLHVFRVSHYLGIPQGMEGQRILWSDIDKLKTLNLLAACVPVIDRL